MIDVIIRLAAGASIIVVPMVAFALAARRENPSPIRLLGSTVVAAGVNAVLVGWLVGSGTPDDNGAYPLLLFAIVIGIVVVLLGFLARELGAWMRKRS